MIDPSVSNREKGVHVKSSCSRLYQLGCEYGRPSSRAIDEPPNGNELLDHYSLQRFLNIAASTSSIKRFADWLGWPTNWAAASFEILLIRSSRRMRKSSLLSMLIYVSFCEIGCLRLRTPTFVNVSLAQKLEMVFRPN
jgi:hypothetical protein